MGKSTAVWHTVANGPVVCTTLYVHASSTNNSTKASKHTLYAVLLTRPRDPRIQTLQSTIIMLHHSIMYVDVDYCYKRNSVVCLSVFHDCEPRKNGWTDRDAIWDVRWAREACIKWSCTLAQPGEYDRTVHVRQRHGLISNYFDHLLLFWPPSLTNVNAYVFFQVAIMQQLSKYHHTRKEERKSIYIAPFHTKLHTKRSGMDHTVLPANNTMPAFPLWRSLDVTITATEAADIQLQLTTHLSTPKRWKAKLA